MKTTFISPIGLALLLMLLLLSSFAQKDFSNESAYKFYSKSPDNFLPSSKPNKSTNSGNVSKKTLKNFSRQHHNVINVKWEVLDDYFLATFVRGGTTTRSLFDYKGRLIYTIEYISEDQLPSYIKRIISNKYYDCKIAFVAKVKEDNRQIWIINLAGKSNFFTTRVEDGEMEEVENFQKAN